MSEPITLAIPTTKYICDVCFEERDQPVAVKINFGDMEKEKIYPYTNNRDYNVCIKCLAEKLGIMP